jgi:CRISPR/Cas system-associated protein Cas10 (large subunit of type III CRISPR-Cas system)
MVHARGGSYKEEIFQRMEILGITTQKDITSWLSNDGKRGGLVYQDLASEIAEPFELAEQASEINTVVELEQLENTGNSLEFGSEKVKESIEGRKEYLRDEAKDVLRTTGDIAEYERAFDNLKELSPSALGGIKSGATRRAPSAFRALFK